MKILVLEIPDAPHEELEARMHRRSSQQPLADVDKHLRAACRSPLWSERATLLE